MKQIISPMSVAAWLKFNTKVTLQQIACACNMNILEVMAITDNINTLNPIISNQLNITNLTECENNSKALLLPLQNMLNKFIISRFVLKSIKSEDNSILFIASWLMANYKDIKPKAVSKLLMISLSSAESLMQDVINKSITTYKNPIELRLCTLKTLNDIIFWAEIEHLKAISKKLTLIQIAGVANWLIKEYNIQHISHVFYILSPIDSSKIQKAINMYRSEYLNPITHNILFDNYLRKYRGYIVNNDNTNS